MHEHNLYLKNSVRSENVQVNDVNISNKKIQLHKWYHYIIIYHYNFIIYKLSTLINLINYRTSVDRGTIKIISIKSFLLYVFMLMLMAKFHLVGASINFKKSRIFAYP